MDFSQIFGIITDIFVAIGTGFAGLYASCKKFRKWLNNKLKDTESIKSLNIKAEDLDRGYKKLENRFDTIEEKIDGITEKTKKDRESNVLTLKYEILDICNRATRYQGITSTDKSLLCELYHQYVDIFHENHYVKSEAMRVIDNYPVVDEYKRKN